MQNTEQVVIEEIKMQESEFFEACWFRLIISHLKGGLTFSEE